MKRIVGVFIFGLLFFSSFQVNAQMPTTDQNNVKANKGFGAQLWLTDDTDFFKKWNTPSPVFTFSKVNVAKRGQPILVVIFITNPGVNAQGLADVTCDITVRAPNGTIYGEQKNMDCWKNLPAPPTGDIQTTQGTMGIKIEDKDMAGRYTVDVKITDNVKEAPILLEQYFDVDEQTSSQTPATGIANMKDLSKFVNYYYQNKDTFLVIPALEFVAKQDDFLKNNIKGVKPTEHFFATIGHNDPVLLEKMKALQGKYSGLSAAYISDILEEAANFVSPNPTIPQDLDFLWAEFMATGNDEPVNKIIGTLKTDDHGNMQLTVAAAQWSLIANGLNHPPVFNLIKAASLQATGIEKDKLSLVLQQIAKYQK